MRWLLCVVAACGSSSGPKSEAPATRTDDSAARLAKERAHHDEIASAHRKLESEQQDALGATCEGNAAAATNNSHARCLPSCYATERPDPRAGQKIAGPVAIEHLVCEQPGNATAYVIADELDAKLTAKPLHGRFPKPHKTGTWQAPIELALAGTPADSSTRKPDVMVVTGTWRSLVHPLTKQKLRCVAVTHLSPALKKPLDACAANGSIGCEAIGDAAARGLNVLHYRLLEARRLQAAGNTKDCQQAAHEAVAVARGMPRWRQYAKLNVDQWPDRALYRTRFDGLLDEDTLFATATTLGDEAKQLFVACGGAPDAPTAVADEQSFHMCW